uniref:Cell division protein sepF homolog n=1 Tax=Cyanophora paradoxa TaxID=2762 RepID=SEPF_CYAPA|nr:hypothetical protein CypaCp073 [Cyanophora paradoxa]P48326.1 RecName: Full=Cell division protein sepF homolog [Cyanophora paradoxa]AAA81241.1 orf108 [Cyanophora paradoxa]
MTFDYTNSFYNYDQYNNKKFDIVVLKPLKEEEIEYYLMQSLDALRINKAVVFNFEHIDYPLAQRILDSLAGATYALGGDKTCIREKLYFFVPKTVKLQAPNNETPSFF